MIDGGPWFATRDVCRILGREYTSHVGKIVKPHEIRTLDRTTITWSSNHVDDITAGGNGARHLAAPREPETPAAAAAASSADMLSLPA
jgi:hypothetical protein